MTQAEWLACTDPQAILESLGSNATERKVRLFVVGCCRALWHSMNESLRHVVEVGERYADDPDGLGQEADEAARLALDQGGESNPIAFAAWHTVALCMEPESFYQIAVSMLTEADPILGGWSPRVLLRCIFGNRFRRAGIDPLWLTPNVVALAGTIYDDRAFDRMPILADALEDAGCDNADILAHCRGGGEHVRGCWVVDLLLGKK